MRISIIISVYKASDYIEECAKSLFNQTYKNIEYVFVDDASPDDSIDKLNALIDSQYSSMRENVIILRNKINSGCSFSRKAGMQVVSGEFLIFVDSDDTVTPDYIEKLVASVEHNQSDLAICDIEYRYDHSSEIKKTMVVSSPEECTFHVLSGTIHGSLCNKLLRTSIIKDYNIYPIEGLGVGEDKLVLLEYLQHAKKISFVSEALYIYNKTNSQSITSQTRARLSHSFIEVIELTDKLFSSFKITDLIAKGILNYKALVLGHLLLYDNNNLLDEYKDLFSRVNISTVIDQPAMPLHYKIVVMAHMLHIPCIDLGLKFALYLKNRF